MLPQAQHPPARALQRPAHQPVAGDVGCQLPPPERRVVARLRRVERAAMPETTVHKDRHPQPGENKIRTNPKGRDIALRCPRRVQRRNSYRTIPALHGPETPQRGIPTAELDHHMPPPARDAVRAKHSYQRQLRVLVPARADARHHVAALGFAEDIGHGILLTRSGPECTRIQRRPGSALIEPESRNGVHRSKRRKQREKDLGRRRPGPKSSIQ